MALSAIHKQTSIAPLAFFRIAFGALMTFSTIRFWAKGWIHDFYIAPEFHFTYYGFDWVKPLGDPGMYLLFAVVGIAAVCIMLGLFYRAAAVTFFLGFTYIELIDKTTYLNHYYFVSIVAFILIFLPAHRRFSLDVKLRPKLLSTTVPAWTIYILIAQVSIVYFYAGVAKINHDWLMEAQPLKTWLMPKYDTWLIGPLFRYNETHFAMSWISMIFDCTIPFFMLWGKTRRFTYPVLIAFHVLTGWLFPIGVFPFVMIMSALIYFPGETYDRVIRKLDLWWTKPTCIKHDKRIPYNPSFSHLILPILWVHLILQVLIPWRYLLYSGDLFWTEEGFRFSWRVMLVEKNGLAFFYVKHPDYPGMKPIDHTEFLTPQQIKQMSFQPDMIIQYAQYLKEKYTGRVFVEGEDTIVLDNPEIRADVFVNLNGRSSQKFIDKSVLLSSKNYDLKHRDWLEPYHP